MPWRGANRTGATYMSITSLAAWMRKLSKIADVYGKTLCVDFVKQMVRGCKEIIPYIDR